MRAFLVGLVGGLVALAGFAGSANASATIDLLWNATGTNTISSVTTSSNIVLEVWLTAGANGSVGGGLSIDYTALVTDFDIVTYQSIQGGPLPLGFGAATDSGTQINNINATVFSPPPTGLIAFETYLMGTVTFHSVTGAIGSFQIDVVLVGTDGIADGSFVPIAPTFNSAFAVVPEPGTLSLLGMGLGGLYAVGRRSNRKR